MFTVYTRRGSEEYGLIEFQENYLLKGLVYMNNTSTWKLVL